MITKPVIWTKERVREEMDFILEQLLTDESIVSLGDIFLKLPYSEQRFCEWAEKYADVSKEEDYDEGISESRKKIKEILQSRIVKGATFNKMNPTFSIFNLKNNYGWKDKQESEVYGKNGQPVLYINNAIAEKNGISQSTTTNSIGQS